MSFAKAIAFVLAKEGGYVNDPNDPGGATNYGIALKSHPELTAEDIRTMTPQRATSIYFDSYWTPIRGGDFPEGIDLIMLDMCVNMGAHAAAQCLQIAVGVTADGVIGQRTIDAAKSVSLKSLAARITAERIKRYSAMPGWANYGNGWTNRAISAAIEAVT